MGLDMQFIGHIQHHCVSAPKSDDGFPVLAIDEELACWRKESDLHEFILTWIDSHGPVAFDGHFSIDDLQAITAALKANPKVGTEKRIVQFEKILGWLRKGGTGTQWPHRSVCYNASQGW